MNNEELEPADDLLSPPSEGGRDQLGIFMQRYRYFVEQTAEGFYRIDFDPPIPVSLAKSELIQRMYVSGYVAECNLVFAKTYGAESVAEMEGRRLVQLHGGDDVAENIAALQKFVDDGFRHLGVETVETGIDGESIYLINNSVGIIEDDCYLSCWGTQRDITELRLAEKKLNQSREQLRALLARLQRSQDDERARCAREIHDELGGLLTGLKLEVGWLEGELSAPGIPDELNPLVDRVVSASDLVDQTIEAMQNISADVRPLELDQLGLATALSMRVRRFLERSGIEGSLNIAETALEVPFEVANAIYHICRESLSNVARHAGAGRVCIQLYLDGDDIVLEVCDDGVGIDEALCQDLDSLGLLGMKERAIQFGGEVSIRRAADKGTIVRARIPQEGRAV